MTNSVDDRYPEAWRPREAPPFDEPAEPEPQLKPLEMELVAAAMTDAQWSAFVKRARGGRS
jgi:hypothetical protein